MVSIVVTNVDHEYQIEVIGHARREVWQSFVRLNHGNYCQDHAWLQILDKCYSLKCFFLVASDQFGVQGILPVAVIPNLFSPKAVSLPYCNYGGPLISDGADKSGILQAALVYLSKRGINRVEIRELCAADVTDASAEVTLILDLPEMPETLWKKIGDKARNQIRKAERAGLMVQWGQDQASELYSIYADNMGRLGTPVHARAFIDEILNAFMGRADVLTVRLDGKAVAAMLVLKYGDTWIDPIASSRTEFNRLNPNMLLYWEAMRQAALAGAKHFDFGRSKKGSGTWRFKRQWGAREQSVDYHTYVDGRRTESASTDVYRSSKAALFAKAWTRLPRMVQRYMGPKIRRYIP
jgi:FemAB-related protein (PEP-CTERM system-associated)